MGTLMERLDRSFFQRHVVEVAQDLLGKILITGAHKSIITETEAYRGAEDPASHAYRGPTPRTQIMFGPPGMIYIYLIYGMHYCLNMIAEPEGTAGGVLIRGLWVLDPPEARLPSPHIIGPGNICRRLGLTKAQHHGLDMIHNPDFYVVRGLSEVEYTALPRVGLTKGQDKLWRFQMVQKDSSLNDFSNI